MLRLRNIEVAYSAVILVLHGISLEVGAGRIVALLGSNGAGKSTTLKAISGLLKTEMGRVTAGSVEFDGCRLDDMPPHQIARMGILQVMEGRRILPHLSTEQNLKAGATARGDTSTMRRDMDMVHHYFPRLKEQRTLTSAYLSGGERQMLVIGRALMAHPKLLLLDEPSLGLAPLLAQEIFDVIKRINSEEKTSVLLVEQNALAALSIAEYAYVLENGRIALEGPAQQLKDNEDIKEFYLGLSSVGERKSYREVKYYKRRKRWI